MTREEAIKILADLTDNLFLHTWEEQYKALHMAIEALSAEAVQGEWTDIDDYYRMATCSRCHKVTMFEKWGEYTKPYDFCPNCGAMMMTKGGDTE